MAQDTNNLQIEVFDPALIQVGDLCDIDANFKSGTKVAADARNDWITDESTRYAMGKTSPYCTGDINFSGPTADTNNVITQYTVRNPGRTTGTPCRFCRGPGAN